MTVIAAPATVVPRYYSETPPRRDSDWIANLILYMPLIGVTFLAKLAFEIGGSELIIGVPMILAALVLGIFTGRLKPHPVRFAVYLMVMTVMVGLSVFAAPAFIPSSLGLVLAVPLAASFELHGAGVDSSVHQRRILDFALFFCLLGIAQYLLQFVIGPRLAYPIDTFGPRGAITITKNYNALIPLRYGASTLKANGVFLLEPSYYSQTLAAGFALEATGPRRLKRLACFCVGFVVAYSGTGLLMLTAALAVLIIAEKRYDILAYLLIIGVVMIAFAKPLGLQVFLDRADEFGSTRSSGYMRYVGGIHLFEQYLWPHPQRALFGMGSGMMFRSTPWPQFFVAETGWVKILIEFGIVGFVSFFGFLFYCIFSSRQSLTVRACIAVTPLLSGILDPWSHALMLGLLVWMPPRADFLKQEQGDPARGPEPLADAPSEPVHVGPIPVSPSPRRTAPQRTRTQLGHGPQPPGRKRLPN
jgi:hypothetical protein